MTNAIVPICTSEIRLVFLEMWPRTSANELEHFNLSDQEINNGDDKTTNIAFARFANLAAEDSDSESTSSSDEPLNSSSAASAAATASAIVVGGGRRPPHHHRKKAPLPLGAQSRSGAVPVATPKVPDLIPRAPQPPVASPAERVSPPQDIEKGRRASRNRNTKPFGNQSCY